jgi:hypothetical protein
MELELLLHAAGLQVDNKMMVRSSRAHKSYPITDRAGAIVPNMLTKHLIHFDILLEIPVQLLLVELPHSKSMVCAANSFNKTTHIVLYLPYNEVLVIWKGKNGKLHVACVQQECCRRQTRVFAKYPMSGVHHLFWRPLDVAFESLPGVILPALPSGVVLDSASLPVAALATVLQADHSERRRRFVMALQQARFQTIRVDDIRWKG